MRAVLALCAVGATLAQQPGKTEDGPQLLLQECGKDGVCEEHLTAMTMDASFRNQHNASKGGWQGCIVAAGMWNTKLCPDPKTCAKNCAIDGLDLDAYQDGHGMTEVDGGIRLKYITATEYGLNIGARAYMIDKTTNKYRVFKLKNREIAFDVDVSTLPCGVNVALYLVGMDEDGGKGVGNNDAGALYGTGYCDARCQHSPNFMQGEANFGWVHGACCAEIDLWEANRKDTAMTVHPCGHTGFKRCSGTKQCGDTDKGHHYQSLCDKDGCDFNPYRMGAHGFFGEGAKVDSTEKITVVTQFITDDGTDSGTLSEIKRFYMKGSLIIQNPGSTVPGVEGNSINDGYCKAQKKAFESTRARKNPDGAYDQFSEKGGLAKISESLDQGMVLAMSLWDDPGSNMNWLDSKAPKGHLDAPGAVRGPCSRDAGKVEDVRKTNQMASAEFTNIMYGEIGSTVKSKPGLEADFALGPVRVDEGAPGARRWLAAATLAAAASVTLVAFAAASAFRGRRRRSYAAARAQEERAGEAEHSGEMAAPLAPAAADDTQMA